MEAAAGRHASEQAMELLQFNPLQPMLDELGLSDPMFQEVLLDVLSGKRYEDQPYAHQEIEDAFMRAIDWGGVPWTFYQGLHDSAMFSCYDLPKPVMLNLVRKLALYAAAHLAEMGFRERLLFGSFSEYVLGSCQRLLPEANLGEAAMLAAAVGRMGVQQRELLTSIQNTITLETLDQGRTPELADLLWGMAKAEHTPPREWLLRLVGRALSASQTRADAVCVARIFFALALQEVRPTRQQLADFTALTARHAAAFSLAQLVNTLWALGELRVRVPLTWLAAWLRALAPRLGGLDGEQYSDVGGALAMLRLEQGVLPAHQQQQQAAAKGGAGGFGGGGGGGGGGGKARGGKRAAVRQPSAAQQEDNAAGRELQGAEAAEAAQALVAFLHAWYAAGLQVLQHMHPSLLVRVLQAAAALTSPSHPLAQLAPLAADGSGGSSSTPSAVGGMAALPLPPADWVRAAVARLHITRSAFSEMGFVDALASLEALLRDHPDAEQLLLLGQRQQPLQQLQGQGGVLQAPGGAAAAGSASASSGGGANSSASGSTSSSGCVDDGATGSSNMRWWEAAEAEAGGLPGLLGDVLAVSTWQLRDFKEPEQLVRLADAVAGLGLQPPPAWLEGHEQAAAAAKLKPELRWALGEAYRRLGHRVGSVVAA